MKNYLVKIGDSKFRVKANDKKEAIQKAKRAKIGDAPGIDEIATRKYRGLEKRADQKLASSLVDIERDFRGRADLTVKLWMEEKFVKNGIDFLKSEGADDVKEAKINVGGIAGTKLVIGEFDRDTLYKQYSAGKIRDSRLSDAPLTPFAKKMMGVMEAVKIEIEGITNELYNSVLKMSHHSLGAVKDYFLSGTLTFNNKLKNIFKTAMKSFEAASKNK